MPTSTASGSTGTISTLTDFASAVLRRLGLPDTKPNRAVILGWAQVENTAARNNPLATTYRAKGLASVPLPGNSADVQEYATPEAGVAATAATLKNYPSILSAFRTGNALQVSFTNPPGLVSDFNTWSGGGGLAYLQKVKVAAQGSSAGSLSAATLGSYDLGNAAHDAAQAAQKLDPIPGLVAGVESWLGTAALRGLLYAVFTVGALGLILLALARATKVLPGPAGYARGLVSGRASTGSQSEEIPF